MPEIIKQTNTNNDNNLINYKKQIQSSTSNNSRVQTALEHFGLIHQNNNDNDDDDFHQGNINNIFPKTSENSKKSPQQTIDPIVPTSTNSSNIGSVGMTKSSVSENFEPSNDNNDVIQNKYYDMMLSSGVGSNNYSYTPKTTQDLDLGNYKTKSPLSHELYVKNVIGQKYNKYPYKGGRMEEQNMGMGMGSDDNLLLKKVNYLIHLIEQDKDEKTNSTTEDIILYSFLGVFIIFIVDSFSKIGKYTR